ncbi:MAG: hypothetical protein LUG95_04985 [Clostridiales bacterium]|nr:hypothetical protein [Clostridiales bacterium]
MKRKSKLTIFNRILAVILVVCIAATAYVINKYPVITEATEAESTDASFSEEINIDELVAGTYGGVEFNTIEDVVNYYVEAYNYTKTLTAEYTENGETQTYYKLVGEEELNVSNVLVEGKSNSIVDNLVPGIVSGLFSSDVIGLVPSGNRNPDLDTRTGSNDTEFDCTTSALTADDVAAANVVDNGDGTITITIQPKTVVLSMPGEDAQGKFFNSLGDITSVVESISVLTFSEGTIDENFVVTYSGGTGSATIDTSTKEITSADYEMLVHVDVQHASITVLRDKSASLDITYANHYPASDEYLEETKGITRN